ncbi:MAG: PIG-L family deacetylase [Blastocatellia bacterium]
MKKLTTCLLVLALSLQTFTSSSLSDTRPANEDRGASGLALTLRRLQTIASVLHTAAHPDDEATELLAWSARGQGARVAYLALNRGEGGQNGIGPELWEKLGVLRTEELLACRKLDGAEQYFTRAMDFGFTRSPEETLRKWDREQLLGDMVRVIRSMRPLVVVNGFSGTARDGHGQHQVAGLLTPEAIKAAADASRFPEQIRAGLQPWQVLKVYGRVFGQTPGPRAEIDAGAYDPVLGRSYMELAADGRSRHRSQDFGQIQPRGTQPRSYPRLQSSVETTEVEKSIFAGLDTTITGIARFAGNGGDKLAPGLGKIKDLAAKALAEFRMEQPAAIGPHLAAGLREVRALRDSLSAAGLDAVARASVDNILARKEHEFSDALLKSQGVIVDALTNTEMIAPGESVAITINVYVGTAAARAQAGPQIKLLAPVNWKQEPLGPEPEPTGGIPFFRNRERADTSARVRATAPADEPVSQPYWLARTRTRDQFDWDDSMPLNQPFGPPRLNAKVDLRLAGETVTVIQPVEYRFSDKTFGEIRRNFKLTPALTLTTSPSLLMIPREGPNRTREVSVEITNNAMRAPSGAAKLVVPEGWQVEGGNQPFTFTRQGERATRVFRITPPAGATGSFNLQAVAEADGRQFTNGYTPISYSHIETHFIYRPAQVRTEVFDVKIAPGLHVGYVMGSGDDGPEALRQLGFNVKVLGDAELAAGDLAKYDTLVLGIRVYEVNEHVMANNKRLLEYVSNGGTLIVQYNKDEYASGKFAPYPVKMERGLRVTDETAPVKILAPEHPLFTWPNRIGDEDWQGWVQERGLYFLSEWDAQFQPLLSAPDDTGRELQGGQLIAKYGKGNYVFTSYAWFRQFPAGVTGAYRMMANLVSLSKWGAQPRKGAPGKNARK